MDDAGNEPPEMPPSEWLTYVAASQRLGLSPSTVAARARRAGWPCRVRDDTGEVEVLVPGLSLAARAAIKETQQALGDRVARAVTQVDRLEATQAREAAAAEERALTKTKAAAPAKRPWWRLGR